MGKIIKHMLRSAIISTIFITLALAGDAAYNGEPHELGVGGCSKKDITLIQSFVDNTVFDKYHKKPHVYFNDCELEVSPDEDRHAYVTEVTLDGKVPCKLTFVSGHYDQNNIYHDDDEIAHQMMEKCRSDFHRSHPRYENRIGANGETDFSGMSEMLDHSEEGYSTPARTFRDKTTGEIDYEGIDKLMEESEEGYKTVTRAFTDKTNGEVDYEGIADLFEHSDADYKDVSRVFRHTNGGSDDHDLSSLFPESEELSADDDEESMIPGGFTSCDQSTRLDFFNVLIRLGNSRVFKPIFIYDENLKECSTQVVAGTKYDAVLSINGELCHLVVFLGFDGSAELLNAEQLATHEQCSTYLTYEYSQTVKAAIANK